MDFWQGELAPVATFELTLEGEKGNEGRDLMVLSYSTELTNGLFDSITIC